MTDGVIAAAARAVGAAEALLVTAGAGMGVDSGLPDFRGPEGFWAAYPPYRDLGLSFEDLADPRWFAEDPTLAWGFYGHRLGLYRRTVPHAGFAVLRAWAERARRGSFVFTSNVDGQFQRAGFDDASIVECHGTLAALQCVSGCGAGLFDSSDTDVDVDAATFRARPPLPSCPRCGGLARPNVLMFGDWGWDPSRTRAQQGRFDSWLRPMVGPGLLVVECGAGTAVPTVRMLGDRLALAGARLLRINVREPAVPPGHLGLALGAREALERIAAFVA